jgi:hypothetical protein
MFNSAHQWVNIVLTKDGIWIQTLTNVVIANPTHADLVPWSCTTQGFVASNTKEMNYHNQHPLINSSL